VASASLSCRGEGGVDGYGIDEGQKSRGEGEIAGFLYLEALSRVVFGGCLGSGSKSQLKVDDVFSKTSGKIQGGGEVRRRVRAGGDSGRLGFKSWRGWWAGVR
jgi:hypothetical protein